MPYQAQRTEDAGLPVGSQWYRPDPLPAPQPRRIGYAISQPLRPLLDGFDERFDTHEASGGHGPIDYPSTRFFTSSEYPTDFTPVW